MRAIFVTVALLAGCASSAPQCPDIAWPTKLATASTPESHRAAALRVLEISGTREAYDDMLVMTMDSIVKTNAQLAHLEPAFREFFTKYVSYEAMVDDFAELYMRSFDELQLRQIEAFYRTPTGARAVRQLSKLMAEGGKVGERKVQEHQKELFEIIMRHTAQQQQDDPPPPEEE